MCSFVSTKLYFVTIIAYDPSSVSRLEYTNILLNRQNKQINAANRSYSGKSWKKRLNYLNYALSSSSNIFFKNTGCHFIIWWALYWLFFADTFTVFIKDCEENDSTKNVHYQRKKRRCCVEIQSQIARNVEAGIWQIRKKVLKG